MPQPVAQFEEPYPVVAGHDVAVLVEIGEIGNAGPEPLILALPDMSRRVVVLQLPEMAGKRDLLVVGEVLIAENEHGKFVHAGLDRIDLLCAQRIVAVNPRNLADENRVERADRDCHSRYSLEAPPL